MAQLTDTQKRELKIASKDAAAALVEDLAYMRQLISGAPTSADIRRLSALLRRILVERDLEIVAAPRTGRISIAATDLNPIYKEDRRKKFIVASCAKGEMYAIQYAAIFISDGNFNSAAIGYNPDIILNLRLESYLKQRVLSYDGTWVSRSDVIKYVANVAQGVHSGSSRSEQDKIIAKIRSVIAVSFTQDTCKIYLDGKNLTEEDTEIRFDRSHVDCSLLEVFATARQLVESPDVKALEQAITVDF